MKRSQWMNLIAVLVATVASVLAASVAYAQDIVVPPVQFNSPASPANWQSQVIMTILSIVSAMVTVALPVILKYYISKSKIASSVLTDKVIDDIVTKSVDWTEEQAYKVAKKSEKLPSNEKLNLATDFIITQLKSRNIEHRGADWIKNMVESKLGQKRDSTVSLTNSTLAKVEP